MTSLTRRSVSLSAVQLGNINKEATKLKISESEMIRRIVDLYYKSAVDVLCDTDEKVVEFAAKLNNSEHYIAVFYFNDDSGRNGIMMKGDLKKRMIMINTLYACCMAALAKTVDMPYEMEHSRLSQYSELETEIIRAMIALK